MIKWYKKFACWMGWHSHSVFRSNHGFDNVRIDTKYPRQFITLATCKWCGFDGQLDSQGNLF